MNSIPPSATILVVEDNPITRKMIRVALQSEGYTVLEAPDGRTALELMTPLPDLILQDLQLPDMDGFDLVQQLRGRPGGATVPILVISGFLSQIEQARSTQVGFTDFLFKPVEPSHLVRTIQAYLRPIEASPGKFGQGRRILAADDDPVQLKLLKVHLEHLGFQVSLAVDGQDALAQARLAPPAAVISDILMPRLDGFRLCLAVRQDPLLAQLPVILTSVVYTEEADQQLAHRVGANAFIMRTSDHREVIAALQTCLGEAIVPAAAGPLELPLEQYTYRVIRQLEHHVDRSAILTRRLALLEAELGILARIVETLKNSPVVETVLQEMLYRCLHAAGISRGAAYLLEGNGRLCLGARLGYTDAFEGPLQDFFGHVHLLHEVLEKGEPIELRAAGPTDLCRAEGGNGASDLLARAGAQSMLLTPLLLGEERLGVFGMASASRELGPDWLSFAKAVGSQISQALQLARTLSRLGASEQRYRGMVQSVRAIVWEREASGRFTFVSQHVEDILGYRVSHWLTEPAFWVNHLHPEDRQRIVTLCQEAVAQGRNYVLEYRMLSAAGHAVWLHDTVGVIVDAQGRASQLHGVMVDITERKRAEDALRASEERHRMLFERNLAGIVRCTVEGRILDCNDAFARLLGYAARADILGRDVRDFYCEPSNRDHIISKFREQPNLTSQEIRLCRKDGTSVWVLSNASWLDAQAEGAVIQGTIIDITERKQSEEQEAKLRLAREIQKRFFPSNSVPVAGFDISGHSYPAEATGGDYFDYIPLPNDCLAIAIGDVSGHGFGSALLMSETRAYLRALTLTRTDVGDIVTLLNRALVSDIADDHFVTLLLGQLEPSSRAFRYTSAGHPRGYVLDAFGNVKRVLESTEIPLGIDANSAFVTSASITLEPGDLVLLLTDGIVEARAPDGTPFGSERAISIMRIYRNDPARLLVDNLYYAVRAFSHNRPQDDDITAVVLKVENPVFA